ncbi:MAG: hypothetical protein JWN94_1023 [Betaproteobacteria bacterium]|nr:hypothetical protein [Betaproteobacteria bacterium]
MARYKITCITKPNVQSMHEHITRVGGVADIGGASWNDTRENVVNFIKSKTHTFYTLVNGNLAEVGTHPGQTGDYLRTYADGKWDDNLLSLPQCP